MSRMISVSDLVAIPTLGLRYMAGEAGGQRLVTWAHVCDLEDPWNWIDRGDLVMTTGPGIPTGVHQQCAWLTDVIDAGASALVIAPKPGSPAVSSEMVDVAMKRRFPLLEAEFNLQFVDLARAVIESAVETERQRVTAIKRLYDLNGKATEEGHSLDERLTSLENISGWTLRVWDGADAKNLFCGEGAHRTGAEGPADDNEQAVELYGDPNIRLVASERHGTVGDRSLLEHVVGLLAMEFRYRAAERDQLRVSGQGLLSGLLDESITAAAVWPELRRRGMTDGVSVVCWYTESGEPLHHDDLHRREWLRGVAPLLMPQGSQLLGLIPADAEIASRATGILGDGVVAGVSSPLSVNSAFPELVRQARLSASRALETGQVCVRYGTSWEDADLFPSSLEGVRMLIRKALGPVLDYDRANGTDLLMSVRVLLENDGNWSRSAEQLHVHRQTLVYRMNKVAELGEFRPTTTEGTALMWFALESARRAGVDPTEVV